MDSLKYALTVNPLMVIFLFLCLFFLTLGLSLRRGNSFVMTLLVKSGFPVLSGLLVKDLKFLQRYNKDVVGVLKIPNTTYGGLYFSQGGNYVSQDFLGRETVKGELRLTAPLMESKNTYPEYSISDMTLIDGNVFVKDKSIQGSVFSKLRRYVKTDVKHSLEDILLYDGFKVRKYEVICAVESMIYDKHKFNFDTKDSFVRQMSDLAFYTGRKYASTSHTLVLRAKTDIDVLLVVLAEKEG